MNPTDLLDLIAGLPPEATLGGALGAAALLALAVRAWVMRGAAPLGADGDDGDRAETTEADSPGETASGQGGLAARLAERMAATRAALGGAFQRVFSGPVDDSALDSLEEALIIADVGPTMASELVDTVRKRLRRGETEPAILRDALRDELRRVLSSVHRPLAVASDGPLVVLVVGVNGSGKTTSIGKLAARHVHAGRKVVVVAADTYRAAAADQLAVWAERAGADLVRREEGADPAAVVFEGLDHAVREGADVILIDTAGRLQSKRPLMDQLTKIQRVIDKRLGRSPDETLLVIDGTMGQNAMSQARSFHEATPLSGVVVTKLDGTAKGGIVLAIASELGLPIKLIGVGEQVDDLRDFEPDAFVDALT